MKVLSNAPFRALAPCHAMPCSQIVAHRNIRFVAFFLTFLYACDSPPFVKGNYGKEKIEERGVTVMVFVIRFTRSESQKVEIVLLSRLSLLLPRTQRNQILNRL